MNGVARKIKRDKAKDVRPPNLDWGYAEETFFDIGTLTEEQRYLLQTIREKRLTIVDAPSGTGKTTLAVGAAKLMGRHLFYVFAPVEEDQMGYRPGTQSEKEAEYLKPLKEALIEIGEDPAQAIYDPDLEKTNPQAARTQADRAWVSAESHIFTRGRNLKGCTVIIEEAQNWRTSQLKKILTRIHDDCKVIVIGHMGQCDIRNEKGEADPSLSGFPRLIEVFKDKEYARVVRLTVNFRGELSRDAEEL